MLDGVITLWFILLVPSVIFVLLDGLLRTPISWIQVLAWTLVTAYTGPIGLFMYMLSCRSPGPGMHDAYTKSTWKQGLNSEMHCLAGDATGVIISAVVVSGFGLANGFDLLIEYVSAFICGLFIFQALMMLPMYGNRYLLAVRKTIFVETVSMNFVMIGMFPAMLLLGHHVEGSMSPTSLRFWFIMDMATIAGGVLAYPVNVWFVSKHLKHGCMTLPGKDKAAPHIGHRSPEQSAMHHEHEGMNHEHMDHEHMDHGMKGHEHMDHEHMDHGKMDMGGSGMAMGGLPLAQSASIVVGTFICLFIVLWIVSRFVPITF